MPKYDAFGREIGEDTLEGLGGTPDATPRPAEPWPEPAAPPPAAPEAPAQPAPGYGAQPPAAEAAAARPEAPAQPASGYGPQAPGPEAPTQPAPGYGPQAPGPEPPLSDAAARQALAAQLRGALAQTAAARSTGSPPTVTVVRRSGAARGCLIAFVVIFVVIAAVVAVGVSLIGGAIESGSDSLKDTIRALPDQPGTPAKPAPRGVGPRSLARKANFAAALRTLRGSELRLTHLRLAPERIDAQLLTRGGRLRNVQVQPGGATKRLGPDSGPGFDSTSTIPFARLRPGAPERLAREGAAKLRVPVSTLQYLVPTLFSGTLTWAAYFKHSRYVIGNASGRWQRSYP